MSCCVLLCINIICLLLILSLSRLVLINKLWWTASMAAVTILLHSLVLKWSLKHVNLYIQFLIVLLLLLVNLFFLLFHTGFSNYWLERREFKCYLFLLIIIREIIGFLIDDKVLMRLVNDLLWFYSVRLFPLLGILIRQYFSSVSCLVRIDIWLIQTSYFMIVLSWMVLNSWLIL